jgi:hypothetical protein
LEGLGQGGGTKSCGALPNQRGAAGGRGGIKSRGRGEGGGVLSHKFISRSRKLILVLVYIRYFVKILIFLLSHLLGKEAKFISPHFFIHSWGMPFLGLKPHIPPLEIAKESALKATLNFMSITLEKHGIY